MSKTSVKSVFFDKVLLLAAAITVLGALVGLVYFAGTVLALPSPWILFLLGSLLYAMCSSYLLYKTTRFASLKLWRKMISLAVVESPVLGLFLVFYFGLVPLPRAMWPYLIGSLVLAPVAISCYELCFKRWRS
jgi:hypothetical protein